ncbi:MAG: NmrA family protein [Devosia sp.]|nr:NmrA family protein [Devosia sp.]
MTIVVAGATGKLGGRIANSLKAAGADVIALVRPESDAAKTDALQQQGIRTAIIDLMSGDGLSTALADASVVVSALQGLGPVIIDAQSALLDAAVEAGVQRFIPSDYAADFTKLDEGENRNFDLRKAFHRRLAAAEISSTSILNGAFMELLTYGMPLFDRKAKTVTYWGDPDQLLDFTTMDDTAAFTAAAALDTAAPDILRIAGDQISARQLAALSGELTGAPFELVRAGDLDGLKGYIQRERQSHPESETEEFPRWQQAQYMHNMQSGRAKLSPLDNERYPMRWTKVRDLLAR